LVKKSCTSEQAVPTADPDRPPDGLDRQPDVPDGVSEDVVVSGVLAPGSTKV
jgi:hypothetical protein